VLAAAAIDAGTPLARVDLEAAAVRVEKLAWVDDARAERDWPHAVRLVVDERVPVAVLAEAGDYRALDGEGVVFDGFEEPPAGLPLVQGDELERATESGGSGAREDALRGVASVVEALDQSVAAEVDHLEVASLDAIVLVLSSGQQVEWGSAEDSALKSDVLRALMQVPAGVYDVSVPQMPTTSGTAPS
jgi:cell division protein FtsQ